MVYEAQAASGFRKDFPTNRVALPSLWFSSAAYLELEALAGYGGGGNNSTHGQSLGAPYQLLWQKVDGINNSGYLWCHYEYSEAPVITLSRYSFCPSNLSQELSALVTIFPRALQCYACTRFIQQNTPLLPSYWIRCCGAFSLVVRSTDPTCLGEGAITTHDGVYFLQTLPNPLVFPNNFAALS